MMYAYFFFLPNLSAANQQLSYKKNRYDFSYSREFFL